MNKEPVVVKMYGQPFLMVEVAPNIFEPMGNLIAARIWPCFDPNKHHVIYINGNTLDNTRENIGIALIPQQVLDDKKGVN